MFSVVNSFGLQGVECYTVRVEVDISRALPVFDLVGLPDAAVKESRDRVRSALHNSGFTFPDGRVLVNLAPADTRKAGALYDLPILVGILRGSGALDCGLEGRAFVGELSLGGAVRRVNGILPMLLEARQLGFQEVFIPWQNAAEGAAVEGLTVYAVESVLALVEHLRGKSRLPLAAELPRTAAIDPPQPDLRDVRGQQGAKRALEIAAAGGHNLLMLGPPGSGKSMLANRLPSILPPLSHREAVETTQIHSVAGILRDGVSLLQRRPFRAPHHTISPAGLVGGGSFPKPGEVSLAHNGVLFLDELPEFTRAAMEVLRQPIEDGEVTVARVAGRVRFPSRVMVVAAMNPCPCGFFGHPTQKCTCTPAAVQKYLGKVSGPLLDRLDLHVEVAPVDYDSLSAPSRQEESSETVRGRVTAARQLQRERFGSLPIHSNAGITSDRLQALCPLTEEADRLLHAAFDRLSLSGRAYDRILKVARTIADLEGSELLQSAHVAEAIQYRSLDRKYWNRG